MRVKYTTMLYDGRQNTVERYSVADWIETNLKSGGIETQLRNLQETVAILGEHLLSQKPELLADIAEAIDCDGYNHELVAG